MPDIIANDNYANFDQIDYENGDYNFEIADHARAHFFNGNIARNRARQENSLGELTRKFIELIRK